MRMRYFAMLLAAGVFGLAGNAGAFILANSTDYDITGIYTAAPDSADWGNNLIKGKHLGPKQSCTISADAVSDKFDLLIVSRDGKKQEYHEYPKGVKQITLKAGGESFFIAK